MPKASTNCWTCKRRLLRIVLDFANTIVERKVGCDRTLPTCKNCEKGQRACQGYKLRLAWPDKQDGRRKQKRYEVTNQDNVARYLHRKDGRLTFLNTVVKDMDGSKISVDDLIKSELTRAMSRFIPTPISPFSISEKDGMLLNHCGLLEFVFFTTKC